MKTIWSIVSFLAVVNLLALTTFAVWLWHSDRLDGERVQQVRELFSMTIPEAQAAGRRDDAVNPEDEIVSRRRFGLQAFLACRRREEVRQEAVGVGNRHRRPRSVPPRTVDGGEAPHLQAQAAGGARCRPRRWRRRCPGGSGAPTAATAHYSQRRRWYRRGTAAQRNPRRR